VTYKDKTSYVPSPLCKMLQPYRAGRFPELSHESFGQFAGTVVYIPKRVYARTHVGCLLHLSCFDSVVATKWKILCIFIWVEVNKRHTLRLTSIKSRLFCKCATQKEGSISKETANRHHTRSVASLIDSRVHLEGRCSECMFDVLNACMNSQGLELVRVTPVTPTSLSYDLQ